MARMALVSGTISITYIYKGKYTTSVVTTSVILIGITKHTALLILKQCFYNLYNSRFADVVTLFLSFEFMAHVS